MGIQRRAFLILVYDEPRRVVVEDLDSRESFSLASLAQLGRELASRTSRDRGEPLFEARDRFAVEQ
jgi:hypothetical protein